MACSQNITNIPQECGSNKGGIKRIWFALYEDSVKFTLGSDVALDIPAYITYAPKTTWYEYVFRKNTASFTSTLNYDATNGTKYVSTEITMSFSKMETQKRLAIASLSLAECFAIVEDNNGQYWGFGTDGEGIVMTGGNGTTGAQKTDTNGYSITLSVDSDSFPLPLSPDAVSDFKGQLE